MAVKDLNLHQENRLGDLWWSIWPHPSKILSPLDKNASPSLSNFKSISFPCRETIFSIDFDSINVVLTTDLDLTLQALRQPVCWVITFIAVCSPGMDPWQAGDDRLTLHKCTAACLTPRSRETTHGEAVTARQSHLSGSNTGLDVVERPWAAGPLFSFISHLSLLPTSLMSCHAFIRISILLFLFSHLYFTLGLHASVPWTKGGVLKLPEAGKRDIKKKKKNEEPTSKQDILTFMIAMLCISVHILSDSTETLWQSAY